MRSAPRKPARARKGGPGNLAALFYAEVARALREDAARADASEPDAWGALGLPGFYLRTAADALDRAAEGLGPLLQDGRVDAKKSHRKFVLACVDHHLRVFGRKTPAVEAAAEQLGLSVSAVWRQLRIEREKRGETARRK